MFIFIRIIWKKNPNITKRAFDIDSFFLSKWAVLGQSSCDVDHASHQKSVEKAEIGISNAEVLCQSLQTVEEAVMDS